MLRLPRPHRASIRIARLLALVVCLMLEPVLGSVARLHDLATHAQEQSHAHAAALGDDVHHAHEDGESLLHVAMHVAACGAHCTMIPATEISLSAVHGSSLATGAPQSSRPDAIHGTALRPPIGS